MSVGLFLPLPKNLASKFPSLGDHDTSPPHATLLYFGDAPEDRDRFLSVVRSHLRQWPGEITAALRGLRHFDSPNQTVAYDAVRFDTDVAGLRSSLISYLSDNGFPATDMSPVYYYPHVTLSYMPPNTVGEYDGPVPEGSWTFDEVEVWGLGDDPVAIPLGGPSSGRVAARYKSKKKIQTKDGDEATVYEYSDRQVANRHREKAERVEHLRNHITDLRARVKDDLKSDDPMTRMTALAVSLMDHTCERVGNDDSADDGHYGVTGWLKKHITIRDGKATIKYVGKSGVKHEKTVDDGPTVTALKALCDGRDGGEAIFDTDDAKVSADEVNDYLAEFDVTAKDIRGFRANDEMCKALRAERAKGPKELPRSRKEKDEILKGEFKRALEHVAEVVGHESATLRSQYLVPGLEDQYVHDGTVLTSLKTATKSDAQREDEATEKLVKPAPKAKPPRHDLRNERVEAEGDPDLDDTDDDLSLNFKKVARSVLVAGMAARVASRYLWAKGAKPSEDDAEAEFLESVKGKLFKTPKSDKKDGVSYSRLKAIDPEMAKAEREKFVPKGGKKDDADKADSDKAKKEEAKKKQESEKRKTPLTSEKQEEMVERALDVGANLSESDRDNLSSFLDSHLEGMNEYEAERFTKSLARKNVRNIERAKGMDRETISKMFAGHDQKTVSDSISEVKKRQQKSQKELSEARDIIENKPSEIKAAEKRTDLLEKDLGKQRERLEKLKNPVADQETVDKAETALASATKKKTEAEGKLKEAEKTLESLDEELKKATEKDRPKIEKMIGQTTDQREELQRSARQAQREHEKATAARDKAKSPVADEDAVSKAEAGIAAVERDLKKTRSEKEKGEKSLSQAQKRVDTLEARAQADSDELNGLVADYASKELLAAHITDTSKGSKNPKKRLFEARDSYESLTNDLAAKRLERGEEDVKKLQKLRDNAPESQRAKLDRELEAAEVEVAVGTHDKYLRMSERDADEDPKASLFRSLNDRGIGVNDPHVQTLLHGKANQADAAKAVRNLATELSDEELSELSKKSSTLGHAYESLKGSPFLAQMLREMIVDEMVGEFQKGRAKGKSDKGKPQDAEKVKELAETVKDKSLSKKERETVKKVVREKAKTLPPKEQEKVTDLVEVEAPSREKAPKTKEKKAPSNVGEYRKMLLDGAKDADARRKIKEMSSEDLNERFEKYKAGKTASSPRPDSVVSRFLSYSRRGR